MVALRGQLECALRARELPILLVGASGTGKEAVAQTLHARGCPDQPFEAFHCAGHPTSLFEAALFGHEPGAFTGARSKAAGACELAGSGTLLLDEIGDTPLEAQPKLLRLLDNRCFRPVGGSRDRSLYARVVAATNAQLETCVGEGTFRLDLYHRLAVITIRLPTLDERRSDIPELLAAFERGAGESEAFAPDAIELLQRLEYPGNVRQLRALVLRSLTMIRERPIKRHHLSESTSYAHVSPSTTYDRIANELFAMGEPLERHVKGVRDALRALALAKVGGNKRAAARLLGLDPATLRASIRKAMRRQDVFPPNTEDLSPAISRQKLD